MSARRDRGHREADRKAALERMLLLLGRAIGQTSDRAKLYLREIVMSEDAPPPGWRDAVATDYPHLVPLLGQVEGAHPTAT